MLGAQTIGNATLIAYDNLPILSTDPWLGSNHYAYFGSWYLPYDIPENIHNDILASKNLHTIFEHILFLGASFLGAQKQGLFWSDVFCACFMFFVFKNTKKQVAH